MRPKLVRRLSFACICWLFFNCPVFALKLPPELKVAAEKILAVSRVRIDGAIETKNGELYLPCIPVQAIRSSANNFAIKSSYPETGSPLVILFHSGWCLVKVIEKNKQRTIVSVDDVPASLQQALLSTKLSGDLIVPDNFILPSSMKTMAGALAIAIKNVSHKFVPEANKTRIIQKESPSVSKIKGNSELVKSGLIVVTSPASGKISLLTYPELVKTVEFPIEGTPSGVAFADGKVYIADQSKARILKLDPYQKIFLGQIDLPKGSHPKDVAALPDGKLIYISESVLNDIAVYETADDKLLVRTKVHSYPGKMAIDPAGTLCLILSVPDGRLSLMSTQTQRFIGTIPVGSLPNGIAFDPSNKTAYVSNRISNTIAAVDLFHRGVIFNLKTGASPTGLVVDDSNKKLYVANAKDNTITIFDLVTHKQLSEVKLPLDLDFPGSMTLLPDKKHILISSASTDAIGLFNLADNTFEKVVSIGHTSDQCLWIPAQ